jgi:hypothetical protein
MRLKSWGIIIEEKEVDMVDNSSRNQEEAQFVL